MLKEIQDIVASTDLQEAVSTKMELFSTKNENVQLKSRIRDLERQDQLRIEEIELLRENLKVKKDG